MSGRRSRRRLLRTSAAVFAIGIAGCLRDVVGEDDPHLGDPKAFTEVELSAPDADSDALVDPPLVHLVDGGTVEWIVDSGEHEVAAYHPDSHGDQRRIPGDADPWTSGELAPDDSFDRVFDVEGVFDYVSIPYETAGAVGSIVVGWPDPDEEPALGPASETYPDAAADALERHNERVRDLLEDVHD